MMFGLLLCNFDSMMSLQLFVLFNFCFLIISALSFYSIAIPHSPHDVYDTSQDLKPVGMLIISSHVSLVLPKNRITA